MTSEPERTIQEELDMADLLETVGKSKPYVPRARKIGAIMKRLMVQRGLNEEEASIMTRDRWEAAIGQPLCNYTTPGKLFRGVLYVSVANHLALQELQFRKQELLNSLQEGLPEFKIRGLKFLVD